MSTERQHTTDLVAAQRAERRERFLEAATDKELDVLIALIERGDEEAAAALTAKLARRAELQGPPPSAVRRAVAKFARRRQRQQVARAEARVVSPSLDSPSMASNDDDLADVIDLVERRQERPAAIQAWIDRSGSSEPLSPRAWVSQSGRRNWAATRGIDDVEW